MSNTYMDKEIRDRRAKAMATADPDPFSADDLNLMWRKVDPAESNNLLCKKGFSLDTQRRLLLTYLRLQEEAARGKRDYAPPKGRL